MKPRSSLSPDHRRPPRETVWQGQKRDSGGDEVEAGYWTSNEQHLTRGGSPPIISRLWGEPPGRPLYFHQGRV